MTSDRHALEWPKLLRQPPSGKELTTRLAFADKRTDVFIGVDSNCHRHLLILLDATDSTLDDSRSRGLNVTTKLMEWSGAFNSYLDIECLDASGHLALDAIAYEVEEALEAGASIRKTELISAVLAKWRRFWGESTNGILSKEQQIGLFGELWFLTKWLVPILGPQSAEFWRGPIGSRHDFEASSYSVEVKTTNSQFPKHVITGIEQLFSPEQGDLFLFSLRVKEERGARYTILDLVDECRDKLKKAPIASNHFEQMLGKAGYLDIFQREYGKLRFRIFKENLYKVHLHFPRLVPPMLLNSLPSGVSQVSYEIDLVGIDDLIVASSMHEGRGFLSNFE